MRTIILLAMVSVMAACTTNPEAVEVPETATTSLVVATYESPSPADRWSIRNGDVALEADGCIQYEGSAVRLLDGGDRPARRIEIAAAEPPECPDYSSPIFTRDLADDEFFIALNGDELLIDRGTGPDGRSLQILDWRTGEVIYDGPYQHDDVSATEGGYLIVVPVDPPDGAECGEGASWTANGMGIGFERVFVLDLAPGTTQPTDTLTCSMRQ